jgi:hypothetical protein
MVCLRVTKLAFPVCVSLGLIGAANASSFTNGDFESPNIGDIFYTTYNDASTGITGWTVVAPGANVAIIGAGAGANYPAESGSQWIDLTGLPAPARASRKPLIRPAAILIQFPFGWVPRSWTAA